MPLGHVVPWATHVPLNSAAAMYRRARVARRSYSKPLDEHTCDSSELEFQPESAQRQTHNGSLLRRGRCTGDPRRKGEVEGRKLRMSLVSEQPTVRVSEVSGCSGCVLRPRMRGMGRGRVAYGHRVTGRPAPLTVVISTRASYSDSNIAVSFARDRTVSTREFPGRETARRASFLSPFTLKGPPHVQGQGTR